MNRILEVVTFNLNSALAAAYALVDRIEVCENYSEGGTTPSFGSLKILREMISIPMVVMIRPRGGDFLYNAEELKSMEYDINLVRDLGYQGVVVGCLNENGTVNSQALKSLVKSAGSMDVIFNRAFDRCVNPLEALEIIIASGCKRLLTSGQKRFAKDGLPMIQTLIEAANDRIVIIPGGGINSQHLPEICKQTEALEIHTPAYSLQESQMKYLNRDIEESLCTPMVDVTEIEKMKAILQNCF